MMQKFHRYDHVQLAKDLGESMSHFKKDTDAIVLGSYRDHYGHGATDNYVLYVNGCGESSWYKECQLTLIDKNGKELLQKWEDAAEKKCKIESDLDWIFENGPAVLSKTSGNTIEALASCLGITELWGSRGEGITYYCNAMDILKLAKPYLEKHDKEGWLSFCKRKKGIK